MRKTFFQLFLLISALSATAQDINTENAREVNISTLLENDNVHRYITETFYNPDFYDYSVVGNYAETDARLDWPNPIVIALSDAEATGTESLVIFKDRDMMTELSRHTLPKDGHKIWNTVPGDTLYYRILTNDGTTLLQHGYATGTGQVRMIYAPSVCNVRDIGGWPVPGGRVRYGRIFRGGQLHSATKNFINSEDVQRFRELGITCEYDLRTNEDANGGASVNDHTISRLGPDIDYCIYEVGQYAYTQALSYPSYFRNGWNLIKQHVLNGDPLYLHCMQGCDRAGTWAFLIEGLLGVSENDLNLDYELSTFYKNTGYSRQRSDYLTVEWKLFAPMVEAVKKYPGETLQEKIEYFWLKRALIPQAEIDQLKACLIEPMPESTPTSTPLNTCSTPSLRFEKGVLKFTCDTPDAVLHILKVTPLPSTTEFRSSNSAAFAVSITCFASAPGYAPSETITQQFDVIGGTYGDLNDDNHVTISDIVTLQNLILEQDE